MESAQGRNGAFVELFSVLVGELSRVEIEEVVSILIVLFWSNGGETGLRLPAIFAVVLLVITVRGWEAGIDPFTTGAGFTTLIGAAVGCWTMGMTGLNPE